MQFVLQTEKQKVTNPEVFAMRTLCCDSKLNALRLHSFEMTDEVFRPYHGSFIPVGSLEFVGNWLHQFRGVEQMKPIEVPESLRKPEFLLRDYDILPKDKLDTNGRFFFKYADELKKGFCGTGELAEIEQNNHLKDGLYVQSEIIPIYSEYRIIVLDDHIVAARHYDGSPVVFFDPIAVQKMIVRYMWDITRPKAYTLDVAVTDRGTAILEVHPFVSVGTYGYYSSDLPCLYQKGISYYIK